MGRGREVFRPVRADLVALVGNHDQRAFDPSYFAPSLSPETRDSVVSAFVATHGADAVPVMSSDEAARASQNGLNAVIVPSAMRVILASAGVKSLADVIATRRESVEKTYSLDEIEPREVDAIQARSRSSRRQSRARREHADDRDRRLRRRDAPRALVSDSERVLIARKLLAGPRHRLYGVVAHEIAHRHGGDGEAAHREAIEDPMGRAIEALVS